MLDLTSIAIVGIITAGFYGLFELFLHKKERLLLIEKMVENGKDLPTQMKFNYNILSEKKLSFSSLKGGCLLIGLGAGLLLGFILNLCINDVAENSYQLRSVAYSASVLLFGGIGLVAAFILETRLKSKDKKGDVE